MATIQGILNKIKELAARTGLFSITKSEFFDTLTDMTNKISEINDNVNSVAKSLVWQDPVIDIVDVLPTSGLTIGQRYILTTDKKVYVATSTTAFDSGTTPEAGWAVKNQTDGYIHSYNGAVWKNTGLTAFPEDVLDQSSDQEIAGQKTFLEPVIVPDAVADVHAVNLLSLKTKVDRVIVSNNVYVASCIRECYVDKGVNSFDLYIEKLFFNESTTGICGISVKRADTGASVFYTEFASLAAAPRLYSLYNKVLGIGISAIIDWSAVNKEYSGFTGTAITALLNENVYAIEKNIELSSVLFDKSIKLEQSSNSQKTISILSGKHILQSNTLSDSALSKYTDLIELASGIDFYYSGTVRYLVAAWLFYDKTGAFISAYPNVNQSNPLVIVSKKVDNIPNGAKYIRFSSYQSGLSIRAVSNFDARETVLKSENNTADISILKAATSNPLVTNTNGGYVQLGGGQITISASESYYTDYLPKIFGLDYYYTGRSQYFAAAMCFYDVDKNYLSSFPASTSSTPLDYTNYKIVFPEGAFYVRCSSIYTGLSVYIDNINMQVQRKINNPLRTKKVSFCGDSIMAGSVEAGNIRSILVEKYGIIGDNKSVGGAVFLYPAPAGVSSIYAQLQSVGTDSDYIVVEGGVNGISEETYPLGSISVGFESALNLATQIGCFEAVCRDLLLTCKKVGLILPYKIGSYEYWEAKADIFKQVAEKWGVPLLDWRHCGINLASEATRELYGKDTWSLYPTYSNEVTYLVDDYVIYSGLAYKANQDITTPEEFNSAHWDLVSTTQFDGWHCNNLAYQLLADKTAHWLMSL